MWHKYAEYVCIIQTKRSIKRFTNNSIFIEVLPRIPNYLETKLHIKPFSQIIQRNVKHDRKEKRNHEMNLVSSMMLAHLFHYTHLLTLFFPSY